MTKSFDIPPNRRLVAILVFEGAQLLDAAGPAEVFATAAALQDEASYEIAMLSVSGQVVSTSGSIGLGTVSLGALEARFVDTLIVAGGPDQAVEAAVVDRDLRHWLRRQAPRVRRLASVCSGAFVLAAAGLLKGRRVATHWSATDRLMMTFPEVTVDPDALFVRDGMLWTSGGVTAGIDMALAMLAEDHGSALAQRVAQQLVLSMRRPGSQSQFSPLLAAQKPGSEQFSDLIAWIREHIDAALDVPSLAEKAGLSERSFQRKFTKATGQTPAAFVERVRVDRARSLLSTDLPLKAVATQVGLASTTRLAAAFQRQLGMTPRSYRTAHGNADEI
jgi:transcriptional regulator GlxA family with amidase domain